MGNSSKGIEFTNSVKVKEKDPEKKKNKNLELNDSIENLEEHDSLSMSNSNDKKFLKLQKDTLIKHQNKSSSLKAIKEVNFVNENDNKKHDLEIHENKNNENDTVIQLLNNPVSNPINNVKQTHTHTHMTFGNKVDLRQAIVQEQKIKNIHAKKQMEVIPLIKLDPRSKEVKLQQPKDDNVPNKYKTEDNNMLVKELYKLKTKQIQMERKFDKLSHTETLDDQKNKNVNLNNKKTKLEKVEKVEKDPYDKINNNLMQQ